LSVAQHSLTVLAIRHASSGPGLTPPEALRELLHDAEEALLGAGSDHTAQAASRTGL
jgi:5'-deoxynucleotidase YfbR-like HD superfamily hydrolase